MEDIPDAVAVPTPSTTVTISIDELKQLIASAIRGGNQELQEQLRIAQEETRQTHKTLTERLDKQGKEIAEVHHYISNKKNTAPTYAETARRARASDSTGGTSTWTSGLIRAHRIPFANPTSPRTSTDFKVRIKSSDSITRLRSLPSTQMVKAINQALEGKTVGKIIAARQMSSGDILLSTANTEHKREIQSNTDWLAALDESASIVTPVHQVLVHGIRIEAVDLVNPETTIESLRAENISITSNARITRIAWAKKQHAASQTHSSLVVSFDNPTAANEAIKRGLIHECIIHDCELWDNRCRRRQCYHCQRYGHLAPGCRNPTACALLRG
jgi:hypothetical protein